MINFQEEFLKDQEDDLRILANPIYFGPGPDDDDDDDEDEDWDDDEDEIDEDDEIGDIDDEIEDIDDEEHVDPNIMDDEEDDEDLIGGHSENIEKTEEATGGAPEKGEKHVTEADKIEREDLGEEFELPHRHHRPFVSHEPGTLPEED